MFSNIFRYSYNISFKTNGFLYYNQPNILKKFIFFLHFYFDLLARFRWQWRLLCWYNNGVLSIAKGLVGLSSIVYGVRSRITSTCVCLLLALFECLSFWEDEQYSVPVHPGRRVIITHRIRPWVMIARRLIIRRDGVLPRVPLTSRWHSARNWEGARGVWHYRHAGAVICASANYIGTPLVVAVMSCPLLRVEPRVLPSPAGLRGRKPL